MAFPCLLSRPPDAERPFNCMRDMRTVKITYQGHFSFFDCLVCFGVCRCLGYLSGGLWRQRRNVWCGWLHQG